MFEKELDMKNIGENLFHQSISKSLRELGYVIIRNAIDKNRCIFYKSLITNAYEMQHKYVSDQGLLIPEQDIEKPYNGLGGDHQIAFWSRQGQLHDAVFKTIFPGLSIYDILDLLRFGVILNKFFKGTYNVETTSHARRISPIKNERFKNYAGPLNFHTDAQHHNPHLFGINIWTPLDDCGVSAPGLKIIPASLYDVLDFLNVQFKNPVKSKNDVLISQDKLRELPNGFFDYLQSNKIVTPELRVGDIMIIHNWTVHSTYITNEMTQSRLSLELRINSQNHFYPENT